MSRYFVMPQHPALDAEANKRKIRLRAESDYFF